MYDWYRCAAVCYAFLKDTVGKNDPQFDHDFPESKWFKRGWTLQELVAPHSVVFLSSTWEVIGTKAELADRIKAATSIDINVLRHDRTLSDVSVAERMHWASKRETTKVEDEAYCLIGIFGINMTPIYGEGTNAFIRLQQIIIEQIPDQSIFAWGYHAGVEDLRGVLGSEQALRASQTSISQSYLLATSPKDFFSCPDVTTISHPSLAERLCTATTLTHYTTTAFGIRAKLPFIPVCGSSGVEVYRLAFLACRVKAKFIALILRPGVTLSPGKPSDREMFVGAQLSLPEEVRGRSAFGFGNPSRFPTYCRLVTFRSGYFQSNAGHLRKEVRSAATYIHRCPTSAERTLSRDHPLHDALCSSSPLDSLNVKLTQWSRKILIAQGHIFQDSREAGRPGFKIFHTIGIITITIERCKRCDLGSLIGVLCAFVYLHPAPPGNGEGPRSCNEDHIALAWKFQDGIASKTFELQMEKATHCVRLSLSLGESSTGTRLYFLSIELYPATPSGDSLRTANPSEHLVTKRAGRHDRRGRSRRTMSTGRSAADLAQAGDDVSSGRATHTRSTSMDDTAHRASKPGDNIINMGAIARHMFDSHESRGFGVDVTELPQKSAAKQDVHGSDWIFSGASQNENPLEEPQTPDTASESHSEPMNDSPASMSKDSLDRHSIHRHQTQNLDSRVADRERENMRHRSPTGRHPRRNETAKKTVPVTPAKPSQSDNPTTTKATVVPSSEQGNSGVTQAGSQPQQLSIVARDPDPPRNPAAPNPSAATAPKKGILGRLKSAFRKK